MQILVVDDDRVVCDLVRSALLEDGFDVTVAPDGPTAIEIGRLLVMKAAWRLDQGERARREISMAKVQVADTLHLAIDTAMQLMGAKGYSKDTPLEWMYRYARQARLVDGASEVHKMVLAQQYLKQGGEMWKWG